MPDPSTSEHHETPVGSPPGLSRWVKVFGIIVLAVVIILAILQLVTGGQHGPGLHTP